MGVETREKFNKELFGTSGNGDGGEKWDGPNVSSKRFSTSEGFEFRTFFFSSDGGKNSENPHFMLNHLVV